LLRIIIDSKPERVMMLGRDSTILGINPAGLKINEADTSDNAIGKSVYLLIDSNYR